MKILAIETSCDETAIAILWAEGDPVKPDGHGAGTSARFTVLGNALLSQADIHKEYGGVFPALAKREHAKNLVPILEAALEEAELLHTVTQAVPEETRDEVAKMLAREPGLAEAFFEFIDEHGPPEIDAIAVTRGPGLEPALWVGINFARALALVWKKQLVAVNHMEGHILSALAYAEDESLVIKNVTMPTLALLISGGHTELVLMRAWLCYELIGQTRDDAVGEAYDKVARMLGLPYPGGPEISRLAEQVRSPGFRNPSSDEGFRKPFILPRPMIDSLTCDFSFAGLKTAVLYLLKKKPDISEREKKHLAHEFENAVTDVLWHKTSRALRETRAKTLVLGGGVSANVHIRRTFAGNMLKEFPEATLRIPAAAFTTDNAVMIALAGFYRASRKEFVKDMVANGNLSLV